MFWPFLLTLIIQTAVAVEENNTFVDAESVDSEHLKSAGAVEGNITFLNAEVVDQANILKTNSHTLSVSFPGSNEKFVIACSVGYHQDGFKLKCVKDEDVPYEGDCFADTQCMENLYCLGDQCRCKDYQHYSQQTKRCEEDVNVPYGEPCQEDGQCNATFYCISDKCSCEVYDYYSDVTKTCERRTYQAPCTISNHCRTNLICAGNKCDCFTEQFFNHSDETCKPRLGPNEGPCSFSNQCVSSLVCDDSTQKCVCNSYQADSLCNTTLRCSKTCSSTSQCLSSLSCINNMCTCPMGWYCESTTVDCIPSLEHSKKCQSSVPNMCIGKDIQCVKDKTGQERCLCGNDMYRHYRSSACRPIQDLQVNPTLPIQRLTDKINFTWPGNNLGLPVTYKAQWESVEDSLDKGETTGSNGGVIVSDLIPGREYKLTVVSTLSEDQYYSQKSVNFETTLFTFPAKPGLINKTLSDIENPPYVFRFIASDGDVERYRFKLTDGSLSQTVDVESAQVEFSSLRMDTMYHYTIVAFSKNNEHSEPTVGTIEIKTSTDPEGNTSKEKMIIIIASSASGAVIVIALVVCLIMFVVLKKRKTQSQREEDQFKNVDKKDIQDEAPYINPDGSIYDYIQETGNDNNYDALKNKEGTITSDPYDNPYVSEDEGVGSGGSFSTSMDSRTLY